MKAFVFSAAFNIARLQEKQDYTTASFHTPVKPHDVSATTPIKQVDVTRRCCARRRSLAEKMRNGGESCARQASKRRGSLVL